MLKGIYCCLLSGLISVLLSSQDALKPGQSFRDCAECPEMVIIPGGSFQMGSPIGEPGRFDVEEGPQRRVTIGQFAAGKFDITRKEWAAFVTATGRSTVYGCAWASAGSDTDAKASWRNLDFQDADSHPVVCISWSDAQDYVQWLSQRTRKNYRLLSEAEWEYAARAGTTTAFPWGNEPSHEYANYGQEVCCSGLASGRDKWLKTSPVGAFPANAFGLYDMHGNVLQWVQDCYSRYSGCLQMALPMSPRLY